MPMAEPLPATRTPDAVDSGDQTSVPPGLETMKPGPPSEARQIGGYLVEREQGRGGLLGVEPRLLIERLEVEPDVSVRRALILALGEFTEKELPPALQQRIVPRLLTWYRNDPDPGIHGTVGWLLRRRMEGPEKRLLDWKQSAALKQIDAELMQRDRQASRERARPEGRRS